MLRKLLVCGIIFRQMFLHYHVLALLIKDNLNKDNQQISELGSCGLTGLS